MTSPRQRAQRGFTMVELMLSMAFLAFLLLFVVSAITQITRIYTKGMALRQINQTGRQVVDDMVKTMRYAAPTYVASQNRLCVGGVSYAWNAEGQSINKYASPNAAEVLRFVSVSDSLGALCTSPYSDISKNATKDLLGLEATLLNFSVSNSDNLWDISLVLSTTGSNVALADTSTPSGFACDPSNEFCAFGDFKTTVYSRED